MGEVSRYGAIENLGGREPATANSLVGQPLGAKTANAMQGMEAAMFSTAPYKPPKTLEQKVRESREAEIRNPDARICGEDGCETFAVKGSALCLGHMQKLGQVPTEKRCTVEGCKAFKQRGRERCRWHPDE